MRDIAEPAVEADGGDGIVGLDELADGVIQPVLYHRLHEGLPGDLAEVATEGVRGHAGDGGGFFEGDGAPKVLDEIGEDRMDPFPVGGGKAGSDAAGVEEDRLFFHSQFLQEFEETDETAEIIGLGGQAVDALNGGGAEEAGMAGRELDPGVRGLEETLDSAELGTGEEVFAQAVGGKLDDDGLGGRVGGIELPAMGEVGAQQDQVASREPGHMATDVTLSAAGGDQGQLIFGMEVEGGPEAVLVKGADEEGESFDGVQYFDGCFQHCFFY